MCVSFLTLLDNLLTGINIHCPTGYDLFQPEGDSEVSHDHNSFLEQDAGYVFICFGWTFRVHRRFRDLNPELVPRQMSMEATRDLRLPKSLVNTLPEFKVWNSSPLCVCFFVCVS